MSESNNMVAKSRTVVRCGYADCSYESQRRFLKRHTQSKHRGCPVREFVEGEEPAHQEDYIDTSAVNYCETVTDTPDSTGDQSADHRISEIEKQISSLRGDLLSKINSLAPGSDSKKRKRIASGDSDDGDAISNCRSLESLNDETGGLLEIKPDEGCLSCKVCRGTATFGVFHYDFSDGTSFGHGVTLPRSFRNLKYKIVRHMKAAYHTAKLDSFKNKKDDDHLRSEVAKVVMRTAYYLLQSSYPQTQFSNLLSLQSANGIQIGDINHSAGCLSMLRDAFSEQFITGIKKFCERTACVSMVVVRASYKREAFDIIALQGIFPDTEGDDLIQSVVVGAPEAIEGDGDATSNQWLSVLAGVGITQSVQLAAIRTNSHLQEQFVAHKFITRLSHQSTQQTYIPIVWDQGELLEEAVAHVKKMGWVDEMIKMISAITKPFKEGKAFQEIKKLAANTGSTFHQPLVFAESHWSKSASNVIYVFTQNISFYKMQIEFEEKSGISRGEKFKYFLMNTNDILIRASALHDVLSIAGKCKRTLQSLQSLPWTKIQDFSSLSHTFAEMSTTIKLLGIVCAGGSVDKFTAAGFEEKLEKLWPTLTGCPQLNSAQINDICMLVDLLSNQFCSDTSHTSNEALLNCVVRIRLVADLTSARTGDHPTSRPRMMMDAFKFLQEVHFIPQHIIIPEECFEKVCDMLREYKPDDETVENHELFKFLWINATDDIAEYLNVVTRLWLINPCDCSQDALANHLKGVYGDHRSLQKSNVVKELIIRSNGPPMSEVEPLLEAVDKRLHLKFFRTSKKLKSAEGTVLHRYKKQRYALDSLFKE